MGTPQPICGDCRFFMAMPELVGYGECRAHPPMIDMMPIYAPSPEPEEIETPDDFPQDFGPVALAVMSVPEQVGVTRLGVWPQVPVDGWCGEHERIPDA